MKVTIISDLIPQQAGYVGGTCSRSSSPGIERVQDVKENPQIANDFYKKWYCKHGHRSLGDLANVQMFIEDISELDALFIVGGRQHALWNGQQRSTRYQDFQSEKYIVPEWQSCFEWEKGYRKLVDLLFCVYKKLRDEETPYDDCRYLLPLATKTGLYQNVTLNTLEHQVASLYHSGHHTVRNTALAIEKALIEESVFPTISAVFSKSGVFASHRSEAGLNFGVLAEHLSGKRVEFSGPAVTLWNCRTMSPEIEIVSRFMFANSNHTFETCLDRALAIGKDACLRFIRSYIAETDIEDDFWLPEFRTGKLIFEIISDIGAFRDMQRHRRAEIAVQKFTPDMGFELPDHFGTLKLKGCDETVSTYFSENIRPLIASTFKQLPPTISALVLPMATRCRYLMAMDFEEAKYIIELRSKESGHDSYRKIALKMHEQLLKDETFGKLAKVIYPTVL